MAPPTDAAQLAFLANVQRILEEGRFTATYKFALLIALVEIAVEHGDDCGAEMAVPLVAIGEKFVEMYWAHTRPFAGGVLRQNSHANIALLDHLSRLQAAAPTLAIARRHPDWPALVRTATRQVREMPLMKLQALKGSARLVFLYEEHVEAGSIRLLPGVAYCLRRFAGLIRSLARNAWTDEIRSFAANQYLIGSTESLPEFLFGSDRVPLDAVRTLLDPLQGGCCFYCRERLHGGVHVDHFVPFVLYPANLAHNFVLAHASCNGDKASLLADLPHLDAWVARNERFGDAIAEGLATGPVHVDRASATGVARWAYRRAASSRALLWARRGVTRAFPDGATLPL